MLQPIQTPHARSIVQYETRLKEFQAQFEALSFAGETGLPVLKLISSAQALTNQLRLEVQRFSGTTDFDELRTQSMLLKIQSRLIIQISRAILDMKRRSRSQTAV